MEKGRGEIWMGHCRQLTDVVPQQQDSGRSFSGLAHVPLSSSLAQAAVFEPTAPIAQISDEGLTRRELLVLDTCLGGGIPVAGQWHMGSKGVNQAYKWRSD